MSRAESCYDNAFMESCSGTLKTELEMKPFENDGLARKEVIEFIRYYNTKRRHSALDYLTPEEFEAGSRSPQGKTCGAQCQRTKRAAES